MDLLGGLGGAFNAMAVPVMAAVGLGVGIWALFVLANAGLEMVGLPRKIELPEYLRWLRDPWVCVPTLGVVAAVVAFIVHLA